MVELCSALKGHDFSRAINGRKVRAALAAEGWFVLKLGNCLADNEFADCAIRWDDWSAEARGRHLEASHCDLGAFRRHRCPVMESLLHGNTVVSAILCKCRSSGCGPVVGAGSFLLVTLMPGWLELFGRRGPPSRPSRSEFILSLDGGPGLPYRFSPGMGVTRITLRSRS